MHLDAAATPPSRPSNAQRAVAEREGRDVAAAIERGADDEGAEIARATPRVVQQEVGRRSVALIGVSSIDLAGSRSRGAAAGG